MKSILKDLRHIISISNVICEKSLIEELRYQFEFAECVVGQKFVKDRTRKRKKSRFDLFYFLNYQMN